MSPLPRPLYHGGMLTGSTSSTSSSVAVTSTAILHDLLLTYSLLEAEPFELLSLERVAELRQEQHRLTASLQDVQERISLEKKMRGATHRLHASGQNAPSAPTLVRREDVTMAMERTDEVMQQYMQVSDALCDVQRQLLSHHIAVLRDHIQSEHHAASESSSVHAFVTPRRTTSSTMPLTPRRCRDRPTASPTARSARLDALLMHEQDASPSPQRRNLQRRLSQLCAEHTTLQDWWMAEKPTHRVLRDYIRDMQQMQSSLKELQLSVAAPDADPTKDPAWEPCMQEAQRLQRLLQDVQSRHEVDATPAQESASPRARERGVSAEPQPRAELRGPAQDGAGPATEDRLRELEERHAQALQDAHDQIQSLQDERQKVWEDAKVRIRSLQDKLDQALQVAEDPPSSLSERQDGLAAEDSAPSLREREASEPPPAEALAWPADDVPRDASDADPERAYDRRLAALQAEHAAQEAAHAQTRASLEARIAQLESMVENEARQAAAPPTLSSRWHQMLRGSEPAMTRDVSASSKDRSPSRDMDELRAQLAMEREQKDTVAKRLEDVMLLYRSVVDHLGPSSASDESGARMDTPVSDDAAPSDDALILRTPDTLTPTTPQVPETPLRLTRLETYLDANQTPTHRSERRTAVEARVRLLEVQVEQHKRAAEQARAAYEQFKARHEADRASTAHERDVVQLWTQAWRTLCERLQRQHEFCMRVLGKDDGREEMDGLLDQIKAASSRGAMTPTSAARDDSLQQEASRLLGQLEEHMGDMAEGFARAGSSELGDNVIAQLEDRIEDLEEQLAARSAASVPAVVPKPSESDEMSVYALVFVHALLPEDDVLARSMSLSLDALRALFAPPEPTEDTLSAALPPVPGLLAARDLLDVTPRATSPVLAERVRRLLDSVLREGTTHHAVATLAAQVMTRVVGTLDASHMVTERAMVLEETVRGYTDTSASDAPSIDLWP